MKGRKRHITVDVLGLVLKCHVSAANCANVKVAPWVLFRVLEQYGRVSKILADQELSGRLSHRNCSSIWSRDGNFGTGQY